jgi:hypothetical protein
LTRLAYTFLELPIYQLPPLTISSKDRGNVRHVLLHVLLLKVNYDSCEPLSLANKREMIVWLEELYDAKKQRKKCGNCQKCCHYGFTFPQAQPS